MADPPRVLVVEDEAAIRSVMCDLLADEGYEVRSAQNGAEGIEALRAWRPDAIVLDVMMPVMDGQGFRAAQCALPDDLAAIPVIVLSGSREAPAHAEALQAAAVILKPFDLDEMVATVNRVARG